MLGLFKAKNDDIALQFMSGTTVKPKYSRYDPNNITPQKSNTLLKFVLDRVLVPWLFNALKKYTYPQFHELMKGYHNDEKGLIYAGRDFVGDLKRNHALKWNYFINYTRNHRNELEFDVPKHHYTLVTALQQYGQGYENITEHEKKALYQTLMRIYRMIYD